jgi:aspartyl-tRNA(Asn)/glutamyl-tRNA(Gln) amidotransferase subunit A
VTNVEVPELPMAGMFDMIVSEAKEIHADTLAHRMSDLGRDLQLYLSAPVGDAVWMARALQEVRTYAAAFRGVLRDVDLLACRRVRSARRRSAPRTSTSAASRCRRSSRWRSGRRQSNATGLPALSLPCGFTPDGPSDRAPSHRSPVPGSDGAARRAQLRARHALAREASRIPRFARACG